MTNTPGPDLNETIVRAAEIAAEEGHPETITADNVQEAFEEQSK